MTLTTHALAGAVIGKNVSDPWLIVLLSIIAHFILDSIRHGEYVESLDRQVTVRNTAWKVLLDAAIGFSLIFAALEYQPASFRSWPDVMLGALAGTLPDLVTFVFWKFKLDFLQPYYRFHSVWLHHSPPLSDGRRLNLNNEKYELLILAALLYALLWL